MQKHETRGVFIMYDENGEFQQCFEFRSTDQDPISFDISVPAAEWMPAQTADIQPLRTIITITGEAVRKHYKPRELLDGGVAQAKLNRIAAILSE